MLKKIYYFASTHWDREWYKTVDEFRFRLVSVLEKIVDTLEHDEEFKLFTLDGQTRILDDYILVEKENNERIAKLIRQERLKIGPWYTMPDEFLLSSESLVRNLMKGHAVAKEYDAPPMKNGYVCDTFGHIANLPQILNGFSIQSALISRGTNDCETPCFFLWESPDGSSVLTFKAPETCGYGSFFYEVLSDFYPDYDAHEEEIFNHAIAYIEREQTRTSLPYVILMDGMDHETIHETMPTLLKRLEIYFQCPVVQIPLDDVFAEINSSLNFKNVSVPVVKGELARLCKDNVMHNKLIPHTLSSRYDLKRANDDCQTLLEKLAMPVCAIRAMNKQRTYREFIEYAYDYLFLNHAHDSICGCSIDSVHREMLARFEKVNRTANGYMETFYAEEFARTQTTNGSTVVKIYNPLPYEYEGILQFDICFDDSFPTKQLPYVKFEQRNSFRIFNEQGREVKYDLVRATRKKKEKNFFGKHYGFYDTHTVRVQAKLAATSFTSFKILPFERPYRLQERFSISPVSCDNGKILFTVNVDGTVDIEDKETGIAYRDLHSFTDCGEIGDGWFHIRPISDETVSSLGCNVTVSKIFDGYTGCSFRVQYLMRIPLHVEKQFDFAKRSGETILKIESTFTIERDSKLVKVHTIVHNCAKDHKLLLRLPVHAQEKYYVNQCNLILQRETGADLTSYNWKETDILERPFENMAFTREDKSGLLFLSKSGLHEVANFGGTQSALEITLLRAFSTTIGTNGEPDGELQGKLEYDYALMPLNGESDAELVRIKDRYVTDYAFFTVKSNQIKTTPVQIEFKSEECAYITCMEENDGIVLRATNYSSHQASAEVYFAIPPQEAFLSDYLGNKTGEAQIKNNIVSFLAAPYKSVNLRVKF